MSYERRHHDRTDHRRTVENRRRRRQRRGPSEAAVTNAVKEVAQHDIPGTPSTWALKVLRDAGVKPIQVDGRTARDFKIQSGDPLHGEKRSDDHIGRYKVVFDADHPCPECRHYRRVYTYRAHHHISGSETVACNGCDHVFEREDWG